MDLVQIVRTMTHSCSDNARRIITHSQNSGTRYKHFVYKILSYLKQIEVPSTNDVPVVVCNVRVCAQCVLFVLCNMHMGRCVYVFCADLRKSYCGTQAPKPRCVCACVHGALRGCGMW